MNRAFCLMTFLCCAALAALGTDAYGRGFGGFGGGGGFHGGFGGGGFGGGGFRGGFGGGGFDRRGYGGFDRGGFGGGDFNRGNFGGDFDRGGFGGDSGFNRSDFGNGSFGQRASGFRGNDAGNWNRGNFGNGNWSQDANRYGSVNRSQVNNFLGLPTDGGLGARAVRTPTVDSVRGKRLPTTARIPSHRPGRIRRDKTCRIGLPIIPTRPRLGTTRKAIGPGHPTALTRAFGPPALGRRRLAHFG